MKYRPEIDGLRAIAVSSVALFHARITFIPGGFVGVDIFFVISGYLITSIIYGQMSSGTFSFSDFYWRRFRRILPAFYFMALVVTIVSYWILDPILFSDLGDSLWSASIFSSNIFFWTEAGYFQKAAELKPLLHTWSLGVEEQYYIIMPLMILFVLRYRRKNLFAALCLVGIVSFSLSVWGVANKPVATFYLLPTRLWELLLGSLLAVRTPRLPKNMTIVHLLQWSGIGLLILPSFLYSETTSFPGPSALLPCVGTVLVIWSTEGRSSALTKILSLKPVNLVGKLSYSFYLWHWPILVLAEYYAIEALSVGERMSLLLLGFGVSWISWSCVERPFRENLVFFRRSRTLTLSFVTIIAFLAGGLFLSASDGLSWRFDADLSKIIAAADDKSELYGTDCVNPRYVDAAVSQLCIIGDQDPENIRFVLWGDSHAMSWEPIFSKVAQDRSFGGLIASWDGCPALLGVQRKYVGMKHDCLLDRELLKTAIESYASLDTVVISARWARYLEGSRFGNEETPDVTKFEFNGQEVNEPIQAMYLALQETITWLQDKQLNVVLIGPVPEVGINVPETLAKLVIRNSSLDIRPSVSTFLERQNRVMDVLGNVEKSHKVSVIYPHEWLCSESLCEILKDGYPLYFDDDHLSTHGADFLVDVATEALAIQE
jgi:peptidoglycan/LPS O-acetylase OafA/YrhL